MRTSSFEHIVRLQFNSLMLIVIKNKVKSRNRQLARHSKREVLFCEIAETKQVERGTIDTCFYDCVSFKVLHFTIYVSDETLGTVLHRLSIPRWRSHPIHENRATKSIWTEPCNPLLRATKSTKRATSA